MIFAILFGVKQGGLIITYNEKVAKAKTLTGIELMDAYDNYRDNFNPIDNDSVDNFNIIRVEILRRLNKEG